MCNIRVCVCILKVNLVSNLTLAKTSAPKPILSTTLSQSATAPSTPLTSLPQTPTVIIPSTLHGLGPVRKRYSDKCNMAMDQGQKESLSKTLEHEIYVQFITSHLRI